MDGRIQQEGQNQNNLFDGIIDKALPNENILGIHKEKITPKYYVCLSSAV